MATISDGLDTFRVRFPGWSFFRSDAGAYYATRLGGQLGDADVDAGLRQTVDADDMDTFLTALEEQTRMAVTA
jgi:hypothetical protein